MSRCWLPLVAVLFVTSISLQAQTSHRALDYYKDGNNKIQSGDLDGAIGDLTKAIELSLRQGTDTKEKSRMASSGFAETEREATEIYVVDPFTAEAFTSRGIARYRQGDVDGALHDWERALTINPGLATAYLDRGTGRFAKGDNSGALEDWDRALRINPHLAAVYTNRGALFYHVGSLD